MITAQQPVHRLSPWSAEEAVPPKGYKAPCSVRQNRLEEKGSPCPRAARTANAAGTTQANFAQASHAALGLKNPRSRKAQAVCGL